MANNVNINQLATAITNAVREYTEAVEEGIGREVKTTAGKVLKEVKQTAPKKTGEYAKGFKVTNKSLSGGRRYVVWNKDHYRRVHLLEFGHAKVSGGRVAGKPHLGPAYDKYADEMVANIQRIIRNGG